MRDQGLDGEYQVLLPHIYSLPIVGAVEQRLDASHYLYGTQPLKERGQQPMTIREWVRAGGLVPYIACDPRGVVVHLLIAPDVKLPAAEWGEPRFGGEYTFAFAVRSYNTWRAALHEWQRFHDRREIPGLEGVEDGKILAQAQPGGDAVSGDSGGAAAATDTLRAGEPAALDHALEF